MNVLTTVRLPRLPYERQEQSPAAGNASPCAPHPLVFGRQAQQSSARSTVTVTFASPRDLEATHHTVVYALPAVEKVRGEVQHAVGDTVLLRVLLVELLCGGVPFTGLTEMTGRP